MDDLRPFALDLLESAPVALVTTIDTEGLPNTRAMFNLRNRAMFPSLSWLADGSFTTYLTTNTASPKLAELAANPAISIYYCLPEQWRGLMLGGTAEIVQDPRIWVDDWVRYYPGGRDDSDHTVLRLRPSRVKYYHQMRHASFAAEAS